MSLIETDGPIGIVTPNNPTSTMRSTTPDRQPHALTAGLKSLDTNEAIRVVVLSADRSSPSGRQRT